MKPTPLQIARLAFLIALTLIVQSVGLPQPLTGPLINTLLFVTAHLMGASGGILLGFITPVVALLRGQLPAILAPMMPFIAIGNGLLVLVFILARRLTRRIFNRFISVLCAILLASAAKFLSLWFAVRLAVPLITGHRFPLPVETVMAFPQLLTAAAGGVLFLLFYRTLDRWIDGQNGGSGTGR